MDAGDPDPAVLVGQFGAHRIGEASNGELGPAVRRLQGDGPVGEGRPDVDDDPAVTGLHAPQGDHGAVHLAQIGDLGGPAELVGFDVPHRCERRGHGHVDPDVDHPEVTLDPAGGCIHGAAVGHVGRHDQRPGPGGLDLLGRPTPDDAPVTTTMCRPSNTSSRLGPCGPSPSAGPAQAPIVPARYFVARNKDLSRGARLRVRRNEDAARVTWLPPGDGGRPAEGSLLRI